MITRESIVNLLDYHQSLLGRVYKDDEAFYNQKTKSGKPKRLGQDRINAHDQMMRERESLQFGCIGTLKQILDAWDR